MAQTDSKSTQGLNSASCIHCGLPVPAYRVKPNESFCCRGCESVYTILHGSPLGESFYRLRGTVVGQPIGKTAISGTNKQVLRELDSEVFLEKYSNETPEGFKQTKLYLEGVHCVACVWLVEQLPKELSGVRVAQLNLPKGRLSLEWNPELVSLSDIARWLIQFGYSVQPRMEGTEAPETKEERRLLIRMGICWALAGNIMLLAFAEYAGLERDTTSLLQASRWASFALSIPVVVIGGSVFFRKAFQSIRLSYRQRSVKNLHMDLPISLGILVGVASSGWSTITGSGEIWFDSVSVLIAALLTARWIQLRTHRNAGSSTDHLLALLPTMARTINKQGDMAWVRTEKLGLNDRVMVSPGELIPVDGWLTAGSSLINASVLTGESFPIRKGPGEPVFAGTTNETEEIEVQVTSVGDSTRVGQLLSWAENGFVDRYPPSNWTSFIGAWFTISVIALAIVAGLYWWVVEPSKLAPVVVSLLVITCPCALGMAAPLALTVGSARAAKKGIFIKKDSVFEWVTKADTVLIDKTGTLTSGVMTIAQVFGLVDDLQTDQVMAAAAALEIGNQHPIGRAFHLHSDGQGLPETEDLTSEASRGVSGYVTWDLGESNLQNQYPAKHFVRVGSLDWIPLQSAVLGTHAERMIQSGHIVIAVEVDGAARCVVGLSDPLREDANRLVDLIQASGKQIILSSGDNQATATMIGEKVGIPPSNCLGNQSPTMKKQLVEELTSNGRIVAMIGDGVNDTGALQSAHVGIAITEGTLASRLAADAFTARSGLDAIIRLMTDAPKVIQVINRNLLFSLGYNVIGATLAFFGLISPLVAAIAMPISSLFVVTSAIAQRTFVR